MLGFVKGKVISKHDESSTCVVLANDVGYEMTVARNLFDSLVMDQYYSFWVHTHVREDIFALYGFSTLEEKTFFRVLLGMSGLGPKHALSLLSEHGAENLVQLILSKNTLAITSAHGVGKKLADRIVLELGTKLMKMGFVSTPLNRKEPSTGRFVSGAFQLREDLASALSNLGYQPAHVKMTLEKLFDRENVDNLGFEDVLREALKELSGRNVTSRTGGTTINA